MPRGGVIDYSAGQRRGRLAQPGVDVLSVPYTIWFVQRLSALELGTISTARSIHAPVFGADSHCSAGSVLFFSFFCCPPISEIGNPRDSGKR
jgi:hypothetical protein